MSKPREFWICDNTDNSGFTVDTEYDHKKHYGSANVYHVIEYSAYENMKLQKDFILAYLNPKDTSFKKLILDFVSLDKLEQDRLIDLMESLLKIREACK